MMEAHGGRQITSLFQLTYQDAANLYQSQVGAQRLKMVRSGFSVYIDSDKVKPFSQSARLTTPEFF